MEPTAQRRADARPNLLLIVSDDHAAHAISAYGSRINDTPHLDALAAEGALFESCFCTNSLCAPSRATILTGTYSHINGVRSLWEHFDASQPTFVSALHDAGYQTAIVGKWHLGHGDSHDPQGFDYWDVLREQGEYFNPTLLSAAGERTVPGYVSDVITDLAMGWLSRRDPDRPFCLLVHHKAPHRPWEYPERYSYLYAEPTPTPSTYDDDYSGRAEAAVAARMRVRRDLDLVDIKQPIPGGLSGAERDDWIYQRYITDYLRTVQGVDDNVGRLLAAVRTAGVLDDTFVAYTSDQGFFLGDHGWYDKRFMYEESLRMPLLVRYPPLVPPGTTVAGMVTNLDFAPTALELAGVPVPDRVQGRSLLPTLTGSEAGTTDAVYYRYWEHDSHSHQVRSHYGVRTDRYKLVYYYSQGLGVSGATDRRFPPEWELFDLVQDPSELCSVFDDPTYDAVRTQLVDLLETRLRDVGDEQAPGYVRPRPAR